MAGLNLAAGNVQSGKEGGGAMALALMTKPSERLAIGQSDPTLRPFQGLNGWFFIDGKDERILGRVELKTHNVGGLARKLGVGGNTPTVAPFQFDALLAQNAPDLSGVTSPRCRAISRPFQRP